MQEADEQDTCRICSAPAEPDQPLFHPCKCSGTIRYIHQDCLTTWLAHSKKKNCDVCKHPYSFTKVYAPDMPSSLPPILLIRRLLQHIFSGIIFSMRAIAVASIWLGVLPWVTVWTWRMYFSMGESTAWWISDRPRPPTPDTHPFYNKIRYESTSPPPKTLFARVTSHPVWLALSADIFTGQIIASLIVLTFVAVFLLREWISQNARPGVFEDEEPLPEDPAAVPPQDEQPGRRDAPLRLVFPPQQARRALQPLPPALRAEPPRPANNPNLPAPRMDPLLLMDTENQRPRNFNPDDAANPDRWQLENNGELHHRRQKKKKEKARQTDGDEGRRHRRKTTDSGDEAQMEVELMKRKLFHKRIHVARTSAARRRVYTKRGTPLPPPPSPPIMPLPLPPASSASTSTSSPQQSTFDFTFKPPASTTDTTEPGPSITGSSNSADKFRTLFRTPENPAPSSTPGIGSVTHLYVPPSGPPSSSSFFLPPPSTFSTNATYAPSSSSSSSSSSPFPSVTLQPPSGTIPFSLAQWPASSPSPSLPAEAEPEPEPEPLQGLPVPAHFSLPPPPYPGPAYPTRPPLPTAPLHWSASGSSSPFVYSPGTESPNLATYRAPEELEAEAGPSNIPGGYFDAGPSRQNGERGEWEVHVNGHGGEERDSDEEEDNRSLPSSDEDMEAERNRYFKAAEEEHGTVPDVVRVPSMGARVPILRRPESGSDTEDESDDGEFELNEVDDGIPGLHDEDEDEQDEEVQDEDMFEFEEGEPWEDVEVIEGQAGNFVQDAAAGAQQQQQGAQGQDGQQADADNAALDNDEADGGVEDDMEGAMEAIGMRGPIYGVFQNAALMIFVLDTAIGLCIWVPFTIGKTAALLSLDPRRLLQVLHLPIRAMRLITDPIVDLVAFVIFRLIMPRVLNGFSLIFRVIMFFVSNSIGQFVPEEATIGMSEFSSKIWNHSAEFLNQPLEVFTAWTNPSNLTKEHLSENSTSILMSIPDHLGFTEPYFEALGSEVREFATKTQTTWITLALGTGPSNRAFAIFLGYIVVTLLFSIYLNILTVGNAKTAGIAVRNAVRQQLLVLKVAAFIVIELVVFPLGCGIVLDLCTVWLFPEANIHSRIAFFSQAPLTAMFYHWIAGTMFMYTFAVLLSGCRSVMRPGAMWFIKDPQDQNSHPIRDILDRPTLVQLRKIFVSGLMYSFVVACVVGSIAGLLLVGTHSIMPFRWKNREPLSNVPVDLLFLHLVLPYTMHYFRPKRAVKEVATVIWKALATRLRLTSYFFGGRHPVEEHTPDRWVDNLIRPEVYVAHEDTVPDGSFRRVPATDHLALPRDMRATAAVHADGTPLDDAARELMAAQDAEVEKAKHIVADDYMVVYIPPHFRWRVITFIVLLWLVGAVMVGFAVAMPIQLGRSFFRLFTPKDVHDGYSLIVGFYLVWMCYLIARAVDRLDKRRQRRGGDGPKADLAVLVLKRGFLWVAKTLYMVFFLGIVIPILLAVVIDLYVVYPLRFELDPDLVPRIRVVDSWALGLLYAKIGMYVLRLQGPNRITRGLQHITALGWTHPHPVMATREVIAPLMGGFLGMILFPGVLFRTLQHFFPSVNLDNRFMFMHVYPWVFILVGGARSAIQLYEIMLGWSQSIRDKEFLVEMRLKNHEPEEEKAKEQEENGKPDEGTEQEENGPQANGEGAERAERAGPEDHLAQLERVERAVDAIAARTEELAQRVAEFREAHEAAVAEMEGHAVPGPAHELL